MKIEASMGRARALSTAMAANCPLSGVLTVRSPAAWGVPAARPLWWTLTVPLPNPPVPPASGPAPRPARAPLLAVSGVSRRFGDRVALQPLDLTLDAGQCVA